MSWHNQILSIVERMDWPDSVAVTPTSLEIYETGIDVIDGFRGQPGTLQKGLRVFQSSQALPYAYAGIAYTLIAASYIVRGKYNREGLDQAQKWLGKAQHLVSHCPEIDFIQLFIDLYRKEYEQASKRLNAFEGIENDHFRFHIELAKLHYLCRKASPKLAERQYEKLLALARTKNQQLLSHRRMFHYYMQSVLAFRALGRTINTSPDEAVAEWANKAEQVCLRMAPLSQDDPWFWHNYSIVHLVLGRNWKAAKYNKKALSLMEFQAAYRIQKELKKRLSILYRLA